MTCPTCEGLAYVAIEGGGMSACRQCPEGQKIAAGIQKRRERWMKKRGLTPPAPRKAVERPPMWNETKEEE